MCFYYDYGPEFCNEDYVTARKEHQCYECCRMILRKEGYKRISGKWDGEFLSMAICDDCEDLRGRIAQIEISHGCKNHEAWAPYGSLMEEAQNYFDIECEYFG